MASPIGNAAIINDNKVNEYIANQTVEAERSIAILPTLKKEYYRQLLIELFNFNELKMYETALFKVLSEFFYKYTKINALHKMTLTDLDARIIDVSMKWENLIRKMTTEELHEEDFKERIKKGALYFHSQLTELFSHLLELTKESQTNNKVGAKRFDNAYTELKQTYHAKHELLDTIMKEGFSITTYLTAKQEAILNSISDGSERKKRKQKENKIKTNEQTFTLFKAGKSIDEIAKERGFTRGTILRHLFPYIQQGDIQLNELIEEKKINLIKRIIKAVGKEEGMKPIKELCPSDITYDDINLVMKSTMT